MSTHCDRPVYVSLGSYGRISHEQAVLRAVHSNPMDPLLGQLSAQKLQLCPQNRGQVDAAMAMQLRKAYPSVEWRLHANVQIEPEMRRVDLCDWPAEKVWFTQAAAISAALGAPVYTVHAGYRSKATVQAVLNHVRDIEQLFGIPVGIEGHYPTYNHVWLFNNWEEYRLLLESGVHYALDLSHLHILVCCSQTVEWTLVQELLSSPQCLELHVSGNDGTADQHQPLQEPPWWLALLEHLHTDAVIFSEGKQSMT